MSSASPNIIRAGALWGYPQLTHLLNGDPAPLLAEVGLSEAAIDDPDGYVSRPAVVALLERTAKALYRTDFGLRLAGVQDVHVLGALAFAIRNAPDLRSAIATMVRHVQHHSPQASVSLGPGENANVERVTLQATATDTDGPGPQMAEHAVSLFCRIYRHVTGGQFRPSGVTFVHAPVSSSDVYEEHFGRAPQFNAAAATVSVERRDLALPLKTANPPFRAIVEHYLQLNAPRGTDNTGEQVRHAAAQIMRHTNASIDDVASMLHMHARTLQRRLAEEGTTFERVRDEVRKRMAEVYLANDVVPLAHLAHLLGYANQSVLTRSCLRWFGKTPLALRQLVASRGR
jgi:AraC-like DNA-binding protein